ncbi:MAG: GCN5-related N-acetyltransferase [Sphingomonas paucimobilis]
MIDRQALEARWLDLTRRELPSVARARGWPVVADHCFQRILLDNAFDGVWYDHVAGRPAYAHADPAALARAVALGEAALAGDADLVDLDRRSLHWRGKTPSKPAGGTPISRPSQSKRTKIERTA